MNSTHTLSQFLSNANVRFRVYDMGRKVSKLTTSEFEKFDRAEIAYPFPKHQCAWLGLVFWNTANNTQHNIWFIRLPLDETGFVQLSARDEFMHMVLSRLPTITASELGELDNLLKDNPYVFIPSEENMALFHAKVSQLFGQTESQYFAPVYQYFAAGNWANWQSLGLQGIAEIALRQGDKEISYLLQKAIPNLPEPVFIALCNNLENEKLLPRLMEAILKRSIYAIANPHIVAASIRALSSFDSMAPLQKLFVSLFEKQAQIEKDILLTISAKAWQILQEEELCTLYLEKLARNSEGQVLFNNVLIDLMFIPGMRNSILAALRRPQRSPELANAIGNFFQSLAI